MCLMKVCLFLCWRMCVCVFVCFFPIGRSGEGGGGVWQQREGSYQDDTNTRVRQRRCGRKRGEAVEEKSYRLQEVRGGREKVGVRAKWHQGGVTRQKGGEEREQGGDRER